VHGPLASNGLAIAHDPYYFSSPFYIRYLTPKDNGPVSVALSTPRAASDDDNSPSLHNPILVLEDGHPRDNRRPTQQHHDELSRRRLGRLPPPLLILTEPFGAHMLGYAQRSTPEPLAKSAQGVEDSRSTSSSSATTLWLRFGSIRSATTGIEARVESYLGGHRVLGEAIVDSRGRYQHPVGPETDTWSTRRRE